MKKNPFGSVSVLETKAGAVTFYRLDALAGEGFGALDRLPYSIRVLLESVLRNVDDFSVTLDDVERVARWTETHKNPLEIPFKPARVLLQDFTGVPALVDLAAMRSALARMGGDPKRINPQIPVDLVIDHSVQVDQFGSSDALGINAQMEFSRNRERYEFLHWGQKAFDHFRVVPPATGIVHQVNLEYLADVVTTRKVDGTTIALPDSLVGTDSHTTMINGLGVLGWGVGGIEAEAAMLGQPLFMLTPSVVGFRLTGKLAAGATATDLVLTVTEMLRAKGVVGKFVEFYGEGLNELSLPDRATLANMAPEYGATMGFFPVDQVTLGYLEQTGRSPEVIDLVERYTKEQCLFRTTGAADPEYSDSLSLDMGTVSPCLAGPKRPQDRVLLTEMKSSFQAALSAPVNQRGFALDDDAKQKRATVQFDKADCEMSHGSVVIAAITSCTNTSNPSVMIAAGLLAKNAVERGLKVPPFVKTSLAPGSRVVTDYLDAADLSSSLDALGFHTVGYGCTTCIGNSGPLPTAVSDAIGEHDFVAASVISGNRNFEGRIHALVKASYLASPPLVVAYALAGTTNIDLTTEPLGTDKNGSPVHLRDIWPTSTEISDVVAASVSPDLFRKQYADVLTGNSSWNAISGADGDVFAWDSNSTYIQEPPFFVDLPPEPSPISEITGARVLAMLGDSITTDHISPAGSIAADSPAGRHLKDQGVNPPDFNSYGSRRGNDRIMTRGTFANIRLRNLLAPGTDGGVTIHLPSGEQISIFDAAMRYREEGTPLLVLAGKEYGTGSSRDWAAKGTLLLGVRAVIAQSYERIHRANLVGMGVLPLQFMDGDTRESLGLTGHEHYDIQGLDDELTPHQELTVRATNADGVSRSFSVKTRIDTAVEVEYYRNGGILQTVLRQLAKQR